MKPIISPWSIYFASRADSLKIIAGCILMFATIAIFIAFMVGVEDGDIFTYKSFMKKCVIISIISTIVLVIVPSTKTIYTMVTVNELTSDNIQAVGKTGKDVVDYITDQIDKIVNDKDEKENK